MSLMEALLLGFVQGATEFLPVSALGHVILVRDVLSVDVSSSLAFSGMLHIASGVAACIYFWSDIWRLLQAMLRKLGRLPVNERDITLFYVFVAGLLPAVATVVLFEWVYRAALERTGVVAATLFIAAIMLMYGEWRFYTNEAQASLTAKKGFLIGVFQMLLLLPGFSRSAAAVAGGMVLGLTRVEAVRFSFLLAIPVTLGIGIKRLLDLITSEGSVAWSAVLFGTAVSFVTSLVTMHLFLVYIKRYTLWPFIWYSIILASLVGYVSFIS